MIFYLSTARHTYTIRQFLKYWAPELSKVIEVLPYPWLVIRRKLPPGTYIFSDLERLTPEVSTVLSAIRDDLNSRAGFRVLNFPAKSLCRYDLLTRLHACGINSFNIYPLEQHTSPNRFPVFIRHESDHTGNISDLIPDQAAFDRVVSKLGTIGKGGWRQLVVEFLDTADKVGIYRKFSAFRIDRKAHV